MSTQTITDFLEARIAEDEAAAKACAVSTGGSYDLNWHMEGTYVYPLYQAIDGSPNEGNFIEEAHAIHVITHDPARVLAECAAKLALIKAGEDLEESRLSADVWSMNSPDDVIMRILAAVYASHADYRQEWEV